MSNFSPIAINTKYHHETWYISVAAFGDVYTTPNSVTVIWLTQIFGLPFKWRKKHKDIVLGISSAFVSQL